MINSRFWQVLQIGKWGLRSLKRAGNGAVGGPFQLGTSINKGRLRGAISGPASRGADPPSMGGVST